MLHTIGATALMAVASSSWFRRGTFTMKWERCGTYAMLVAAAGTLCLTPGMDTSIGKALYDLTGYWQMNALLGHVLQIFSVVIVVASGLSRTMADHHAQWVFTNLVQRPVTIGVPLMVFMLCQSSASRSPGEDIFAIAHHNWLIAYWGTFLLAVGPPLGLWIRLSLALRGDPRSRRTANLWLAAAMLAMTSCLCSVAAGLDTDCDYLPLGDLSIALAWASIVCFALAMSYSWRQKMIIRRAVHESLETINEDDPTTC